MRSITYRILFGLVLLAAIVGIGLLAYNAGVTHGAAVNAVAPASQNGSPVYPYYPVPFWGFFPFFGFGFFGFFALILLFFVALGAIRRILWGPRSGWHRWHRMYGAENGTDEGIPPMMAEMHRRIHAADEDANRAGESAQKQD
jgi:hypothetical protein